MIETTVTVRGPLFDGTATTVLHKAIDDCQRHMAGVVEEIWHAYMDASFKVQTGYYQSHVNIAQRGRDLAVNDDGVIYGFWLEGIGSRNFPVTRFKGYAAARRAAQHANGMTLEECQPIIDRAVHEING
jgi:hypothetical protein